MPQPLSDADYQRAASTLGCDVAAVKAVAEVESAGFGFNPDGTCKILFEAHIFDKETNGVYRTKRPDLSSKSWNKALYAKTQEGEWRRFRDATNLDAVAAIKATSWGRFQILGRNAKSLGYLTAAAFCRDMQESEAKQLDAFIKFIQVNNLATALKDHDWAAFARGYNGPKYGLNRYDVKLASAYRKYAVGSA